MQTDAQSTTDTSALFRPFRLKTLSMKNRIVMAPMTRFFSPDGFPGEDVAAYYQRRAAADVGLIISEGTVVDRPASRNSPKIPFFHGEALNGWQTIIEQVHGADGRMGPQIWHTGAVAEPSAKWEPDAPVESPSGLIAPDMPRGQTMSEEDIADTIAAFAKAAADAKRLGFDVSEIHGAHGYLIDQFFWAGTNRRDDAWGGASLPERARFAAEILRATRAAVGPDFPIILRVSQWKQQDYKVRLAPSPDELTAWLGPLVEAGADMLHCSQRRFWEPEFPELDGENGLNFAGWAKKLTGAPTISVGSVGLDGDFFGAFGGRNSEPAGLEKLVERMERDEFDLIAVGRALLSDPLWVKKVRGEETAPFEPFEAASMRKLY